jgi:hypothetical protein
MKLRWQFGIIAGIFLVAFMLYPQLRLWNLRGSDWQGNYAYIDVDEAAYAAYIRALIDGRPRKNDPYTGRDERPENPQPESLFSIQFAAPYLAAIPARILGVSAPWTMILISAFAGFFAALAAFWLIGKITGDSWFAMAGSLVVLAGGALAAGEGAIGEIFEIGQTYPYFPAFRRYIPAIAIPFFFALCALVWQLVTTEDLRWRIIYCVLASLSFSFLVFSYFYIWTTAAAWLVCVVLLWLAARPEGLARDFKAFLVLGSACLLPLAPYAYMLSKRTETMDNVQLLVRTHAPDFYRVPEYISAVVLLMLLAGVWLKLIVLRERATLFAFSFALVPIVVFNQQIITGRSLQPIHYQVFIGNYVAALALVITIGILWRKISAQKPLFSKIIFTILTLSAIVWGFVECFYTVRVWDDTNIARDDAMSVAQRLEELARGETSPHQTTVLAYSVLQGDDLPTLVPQNVLWAHHQHVFAGLSWEESKERYYQYLYYHDLTERDLENLLRDGERMSTVSLFGWGRHTDRLTSEAKPLTYGEIAQEARKYGEYRRNFNINQASSPTISYVVVPNDWNLSFANLDLWYERDAGEKLGAYTLYKVKLKSEVGGQ